MIRSISLLLLTVLPLDLLFIDTFLGDGMFLPSNDLGFVIKITLFAFSTFMMLLLSLYSDIILQDLASFGLRILEFFNNICKLKMKMSSITTSPSTSDVIQNDDLLVEILLRLPPKFLLTLKYVSKRWRMLISSPQFGLRWGTKPACGFFLQNTRSYPDSFSRPRDFTFISLTSLQRTKLCSHPNLVSYELGSMRMVSSCNGLILLQELLLAGKCYRFAVYNRTNNMHKTLPLLHVHVKQLFEGAVLAFDPSKSPHYKVFVCIKDKSTLVDENFHLEIYSSDTCTWRRFDDKDDVIVSIRYLDYHFPTGHFWNGVIIWQGNHDKFYVFDVDEEYVRDIPFPRLLDVMYMGESEGHLNLVLRGNELGYEVLELERDFNTFSFKGHVELNKVLKDTSWVWIVNQERYNNVPWFYSFNILTLVRGRGEDLAESYLVFLINRNLVMSYDLKNNTLGFLGKLSWKLEGVLHNDVQHYNISLHHI